MRVPALLLSTILSGVVSTLSYPQIFIDGPQIPPNFNVDIETGKQLRPQLIAQSMAPTGRYSVGRVVFERLVEQVPRSDSTKFAWELRIIDGDQLNAYSSPEGTIYVDTSLAQLVDQSAGLWAAILSHEVSHVVRRDWARRYLYQQSLERGSAQTIVLGDPGFPSGSWSDSGKVSENLGQLCRQLELNADRDSLRRMALAGYHPYFVPALQHLLHVKGSGAAPRSFYAMHPCWEERDRELIRAYVSASIEFEHRWPEWYASPGGNPPTVVFAAMPTIKKTSSKEWQIQMVMRCENLAGAVEVVLQAGSRSGNPGRPEHLLGSAPSDFELREVTGCTSPLTTITFTLPAPFAGSKPGTHRAEVSVFDGWGAVLASLEIPRLPD